MKNYLLYLISIFLFVSIIYSTDFVDSSEELEGEEYLAFAEEMASPIGGLGAILKKVEYPELARKAGVEGKVYVMAFISTSGEVDDVKVIKGIGGGCDEAAVMAVKNSKFNPAKNEGKNVKVKYALPITFKIN